MRLECKRADAATKWYDIRLLPLDGNDYAVVVSYGIKSDTGGDSVIQAMEALFKGPFLEAQDLLLDKMTERKSIGYEPIVEPILEK